MKILLIEPASENVRAKRAARQVGSKIFRTPPLGLLMVAGATPKGHDVEICDEHVSILNMETDADIIGISVNTCVAKRAYALSREFRNRGKKVVLGGFHVSFNPDEAVKNADCIVVGEAEGVWPRVIEDLRTGKQKKVYNGTEFGSLALPAARRDLVKKEGYFLTNVIQATRGCPFKCQFCGVNQFFNGTFRTRPVIEVVNEIKAMQGFKLLFTDDNLIGNPAYAKELFRKMAPLKKKWMGQASINIAGDEELLRLASKSGCVGLFLGFETISQKNLKDAAKYQNKVSDYRQVISKLHSHGIAVAAGTIYGFDNDTPEIFKEALSLFEKAGLDVMQIDPLTPFPGTPLHCKLKDEKRLISSNWDDYDIYKVVYTPKSMSPEQLQQGLTYLRRHFYTPLKTIKRTIRAFLYGGLVCAYMVYVFNHGYWKNHSQSIGYPP